MLGVAFAAAASWFPLVPDSFQQAVGQRLVVAFSQDVQALQVYNAASLHAEPTGFEVYNAASSVTDHLNHLNLCGHMLPRLKNSPGTTVNLTWVLKAGWVSKPLRLRILLAVEHRPTLKRVRDVGREFIKNPTKS